MMTTPATEQFTVAAGPYAAPRLATSLDECFFYHTMDIPGHGTVAGEWDLRAGVTDYVGRVPVRGKRVLDVGTASGFLCFQMERAGAEVVAFDAARPQQLNVVPYSRSDYLRYYRAFQQRLPRLHNSFWLAHHAFESRSRVVYGDIYDIPAAIGPVDIALFGSVLLHLRDPFQALFSALRLVRESVIVTEPYYSLDHYLPRGALWRRLWRRLAALATGTRGLTRKPALVFLPDCREPQHPLTWWSLSPELVCRFLGILGFEDYRVSQHVQRYNGHPLLMFTVVGRRTLRSPECLA
jgi:hypothetical protein